MIFTNRKLQLTFMSQPLPAESDFSAMWKMLNDTFRVAVEATWIHHLGTIGWKPMNFQSPGLVFNASDRLFENKDGWVLFFRATQVSTVWDLTWVCAPRTDAAETRFHNDRRRYVSGLSDFTCPATLLKCLVEWEKEGFRHSFYVDSTSRVAAVPAPVTPSGPQTS